MGPQIQGDAPADTADENTTSSTTDHDRDVNWLVSGAWETPNSVEAGAMEDAGEEDDAEDLATEELKAAPTDPSEKDEVTAGSDWQQAFAAMQAHQSQIMSTMLQVTQTLASMSRPATAEPQKPAAPMTVDAIMLRGLEAAGIDPDSEEAQDLLEAFALGRTSQYFGEDAKPRIEQRLARANTKTRRLANERKLQQEVGELRAKIAQMEAATTRTPVFARAAAQLQEYSSEFPNAHQLPREVVTRWLEEDLAQLPAKASEHGPALEQSIRKLDQMIADAEIHDADDARRMARLARMQGSPYVYLLEALVQQFETSSPGDASELAESPALRKPARRRPMPAARPSGGQITGGRPDPTRAYLEADTPEALQGVMADLRRFGQSQFNHRKKLN